jgi:hypothetical protein
MNKLSIPVSSRTRNNSSTTSQDKRMHDYLAPRGLDGQDAKRAGLTYVDAKTAGAHGFSPAHEGILIPYFHPITGKLLLTRRIRYLNPPTIKGKLRRYAQLEKTPVEAYFALGPDWKRIFADPNIPLHIVEGEIKALTAIKHGFITVGLGGVYNFGGDILTPLLREVSWKGRKVYICFDSDAVSNNDVMRAEHKLATVLS